MSTESRNFVAGVMNKELDERLLPAQQYTDATNVKISPSGGSNDGTVKNTKGNELLGSFLVDGVELDTATTIGSFEDGANDKIYWFVTGTFTGPHTSNKCDAILSYNSRTKMTTSHVVSMQSPTNTEETVLNFSTSHLINSIDLVGDLLFFTDGFNQPRKINISRGYEQPSLANNYMDTVPAEEFLVIKKPPVTAPTALGTRTNTEDTYMEDKFISFAYRYKYVDGEYSATSQFSAPVFSSKPFNLSETTVANQGFENSFNGATITYNTGGSEVVGIDILYKELGNNIIKIADRISKETRNLVDNSEVDFIFEGNKTFTLLDQGEILRLYDNVPHTAKTQTIMSNRLVYGNYTEGYDMLDSNGDKVDMGYGAYITNSSQGFTDITSSEIDTDLSMSGTNKVSQSAIELDLSGQILKEGSSISMSFDLTTAAPDLVNLDDVMAPVSIDFTYTLRQDFSSVAALVADSDFLFRTGVFGEVNNIYYANPLTPTSCAGTSLTEAINCAYPDANGTKFLYSSGIHLNNDVVAVSSEGDVITLVLPAVVRYVDDLTAPTESGYGFAVVTNLEVRMVDLGNGRSLHSTRGYEAAIIYMDDFGRSSTPQVSPNSSTRTVARDSGTVNKLSISIPDTQNAPSWATRYKVIMKQTEDSYDTVYTHTFYKDDQSNNTYFLLEGENAAKVEKGDELIVKRDAIGIINKTIKTVVLDKTVEAEDFKTFYDEDGNDVVPPAGVYAKINTKGFATETGENNETVYSAEATSEAFVNAEFFKYATAEFGPFEGPIDEGVKIRLQFDFSRNGSGDGNNNCEKRKYSLDKSLVASRGYDTFFDWWVGDDVQNVLDQGTQDIGGDGEDVENEMIYNGFVMGYSNYGQYFPYDENTNYYGFVQNFSGEPTLRVRGTKGCGTSDNKRSHVSGSITVGRTGSEIVFESTPETALEDVWYENEESFPIVGGFHTGNIADQTASTPAVVDTSFFNCISFGNGVESIKIHDSIIGNKISLGHRVHSTSAIDFKTAHRFADLTYSGVINDESNINKLNAFNSGLLNFKACEDSFGPIEIIDGRKTDILVLQEDKISVVMAGKNLLSMTDSVEGGALVSVPDVLGSQISRDDDYGISNNPESYCSYGSSRYFTDAKRGAVIELTGENLAIISNNGMTTFFKDAFINNTDTYKIGGYDPYSDEYVLHSSDQAPAASDVFVPCGAETTVTASAGEVIRFQVDYGSDVGEAITNITIPAGTALSGSATYAGAAVGFFDNLGTNATITIDKDSMSDNIALFTLETSTGGTFTIDIDCVTAEAVSFIKVVLTDNGMVSTTSEPNSTRTGYRRAGRSGSTRTRNVFNSSSDEIIVDEYSVLAGSEGNGPIPAEGEEFFAFVTKTNSDSFTFDPTLNSIYSMRSNVLYDMTSQAAIAAMLSAATQVTPVTETAVQGNGDVTFEGSFIAPVSTDDYMYVIYDLRTFTSNWLSYSTTALGACCDITCGPGACGVYAVINGNTSATLVSTTDCDTGLPVVISVGALSRVNVTSTTEPTLTVASSNVSITLQSCVA